MGGNPSTSGFVIIEFVPMRSTNIGLLFTLSFTTRNLMSMCFDLDELLLLLEYRTVDLLSQHNFCGLSMFPNIHSSVTKFHNHIP